MKYIVSWEGHEAIRDELIAAAIKYRDESDKCAHIDTDAWMTEMMCADKGKHVQEEMQSCGQALVELLRLQKKAINEHYIAFELVRHTTIPYTNPNENTKLLDENLENARRWARGEFTAEDVELGYDACYA